MQIRTAIKNLRTTGEITVQTTNNFSIISVTNWFEYQADNTPDNRPITGEQQSDNTQITAPKECNNIINNTPLNPPKDDLVEVPECVSPDVWIKWVDHRKEIRKKLTKTSAREQIKNLERWHSSGHDPNAIIKTSIANGWTGLFEPKEKPHAQTQTRYPSRSEQADAACAETLRELDQEGFFASG